VTRLHVGVANGTWLVDLADDGARVVVKGGVNAPPGVFRVEADGLAVLREHLAPVRLGARRLAGTTRAAQRLGCRRPPVLR